jgi:protein SCO1
VPPRLVLAALSSGVVVLVVLVVLAVARPVEETVEAGVLSPESPYEGAARDGGGRAPRSPAIRLRDQDGRVRTLEGLRGRPVIVTFLYATCEDTCPAMARQVSQALDVLGGGVPTLIVSVDPERDTPEAARRFLNRMDLRGRASFLLGTRERLAPIWRAYGIQPQGLAFDHSAYVLVLDRSGGQRVAWPADKLTSDGLARDVGVVARLPGAPSAAPGR